MFDKISIALLSSWERFKKKKKKKKIHAWENLPCIDETIIKKKEKGFVICQ